MRNKEVFRAYSVDQLGFPLVGEQFDHLIEQRDNVEIHFSRFSDHIPKPHYGQV